MLYLLPLCSIYALFNPIPILHVMRGRRPERCSYCRGTEGSLAKRPGTTDLLAKARTSRSPSMAQKSLQMKLNDADDDGATRISIECFGFRFTEALLTKLP